MFRRSEQMKSFLTYVCESDFRGESAAINEYAIGVEVLGRPAGYSPAEDSSVRTRAYELRHRLERLYAEELIDESVRIVIPKGAYSPSFIRFGNVVDNADSDERNLEPGAKERGTADQTTENFPPNLIRPARSSGARSERWLWGAILLMAACAIFALLQAIRRPIAVLNEEKSALAAGRGSDPIVKAFWSPVAKPSSQTLLVTATPLFLVLGPQGHRAYRTDSYPAPAEGYALFREHRPLAKDAKLGMIFTEDAVGVGNMEAVVLTSKVLASLGAESEIVPERPSMMAAFHDRNVVLFGAPVDSAVISELLANTPLTVDYDDKDAKEFVIRDRQNGQMLVPDMTPDGDFRTVYGLITVLNTRESAEGRNGMIVFSGITSVGTHGAAEYFASPRYLRTLAGLLSGNKAGRLPPSYQVVVKCKTNHLLLVSEEYQSHRVIGGE